MKTLKQYILEADDESTSKDDELDMDALNSDEPDGKTGDDEDKSEDDKEDPEDEEKKKLVRRGNIKFTIWEEPKKKVNWLTNNEKYQKIEYQYRDKEKNINIDFLLGFKDNSWQLWIGKIGAVSYDDDPMYNLETNKFAEGIVSALDKIEELIDNVEENPDNWVQFYKS